MEVPPAKREIVRVEKNRIQGLRLPATAGLASRGSSDSGRLSLLSGFLYSSTDFSPELCR
jgi:hypothetical protein